MSAPKRIQRQRTKGWRMPEGAVYVGRPTRWGNPYKAGSDIVIQSVLGGYQEPHRQVLQGISPAMAVDLYRIWATHSHVHDVPFTPHRLVRDKLRGKDLACWCPLDQPCHADVLLELANGGDAA